MTLIQMEATPTTAIRNKPCVFGTLDPQGWWLMRMRAGRAVMETGEYDYAWTCSWPRRTGRKWPKAVKVRRFSAFGPWSTDRNGNMDRSVARLPECGTLRRLAHPHRSCRTFKVRKGAFHGDRRPFAGRSRGYGQDRPCNLYNLGHAPGLASTTECLDAGS